MPKQFINLVVCCLVGKLLINTLVLVRVFPFLPKSWVVEIRCYSSIYMHSDFTIASSGDLFSYNILLIFILHTYSLLK